MSDIQDAVVTGKRPAVTAEVPEQYRSTLAVCWVREWAEVGLRFSSMINPPNVQTLG